MNKKLLALLGVYVGGVTVAMLYNKKKPSDIEKELETAKTSGEGSFKILFDNFIEIHQNFLENVKDEVWTPKNKKYFNSKKDELFDILSEYKDDGEKLLKDLEVKGKDYALDSYKKLESKGEEKLKELKNKTPEKFGEFKEKLKDFFEDLKKKINEK